MLTRLFGSLAAKVTLPIGRGLGRLGITPNMMTIAGFLVIAAGCVLVARGQGFLGGWILIAGGAFDLLDGAVAKGAGKSTVAGAFLDSTLDRVSDGAVFISIAVPHMVSSPDYAIVTASSICLFLGFVTSYIRARAEGLGLSCRVGIAERPERMLVAALGLIFGVTLIALILLSVLSAITVVQRFTHVWKQARASTPA